MTLPRFAVGQCSCTDEEYQCSRNLQFRHYYLWLFLQGAFYHNPPLRVLEVHVNGIRGLTIHITKSKIHISYSENHDSTLLFYYFYMSPLPSLRVVIFRSVLLLILQNYKKKNCLDVLLTGRFPFPTSMDTHIYIPYPPMAMGTQLGFKRHWESH